MRNEIPLGHNSKPRIIEFMNTNDFTSHVNCSVPISEPLFEAIPPVIIFSDYEALKTQTLTLKLRNKDSVSRRVRIMQPSSNLFMISQENGNAQGGLGQSVAPGLELQYQLRFSPETKSDYSHELVIVTEREKFIVPIFAIGKKSLLDFPDSVNFGNECPVKYVTEKSVILHNIGDKSAKWELKLPEGFSSDRNEGLIHENETVQILLKFFPIHKRLYEDYGCLSYDGTEAFFSLRGMSINGEVALSTEMVSFEETYISLENKQTVKIYNKSSVKIDFEWRSFSSEGEEIEKKKVLMDQIGKEEEEKRKIIKEMIDLEDNNEGGEGQEGEPTSENEGGKESVQKRKRQAELLLERKYRGIRKAVEEDKLAFEDPIFQIEPINGSIWPNSEMIITVIFKPKLALKYELSAFCNVSCSDERLQLKLEGEGLGPKAFLSTNILSIGDIFVNDKQSYNLYIENKGEISAHFQLIKAGASSSNIITFDKEEGILSVGQRLNIVLTFQSYRVGEFQELFRWRLEGSQELLQLLVRGHVRSPRFEFDKKVIDFKKVSFQFEVVQELSLTNTSTVMFTFGLRIPQDGKGSNREFEIIPASDSIQPMETKKIVIKFVPHFRKSYNMVLVLDMEGIGRDMKSMPILAESDVPKVRLGTDTLDFGEIFLRYPQTREIELINESKLFARFVAHPINQKFAAFGKVATDLDKGQIPPESTVKLSVSLTTCCLKMFSIDFIIEIVSDLSEQYLIKIKGNSIGPIVELSHKEIDFEQCRVLEKQTRKVAITNKSIIEADFYAFTKNKHSIFKPVQRHYVLKPSESFDIEIICIPDDTQKFTDTLFFVIKEGVDKEVKLKAQGIGSTISCKDISVIDFGVMYTYKTQMQEVFIENKGRKAQLLKWQKKVEGQTKKGDAQIVQTQQAIDNQGVFVIYPDSMQLPPKTGLMFQFRAYSKDVGKIKEPFQLTSTVVNDRKTNILFTSSFEAEFVTPSLVFSKKVIDFKYIWEKETEPQVIAQELEIVCGNKLPTSFQLYIDPPFNIHPEQLALMPGKKAIARVDFDPTIKLHDRVSRKIEEKLWVKYNQHPKNEQLQVQAQYCYPNIKLDKEEINFGAVMNDTIRKASLVMKNVSIMAVDYQWYFLDEQEGSSTSIPLNEVFDILPLRGSIEPENEERIEFSYFAIPFKSFEISAICKIEGGPDYKVVIKAEASNVEYSLSLPTKSRLIDIGEAFISSKVQSEFEVENTSKVMFDYSIRHDLSLPKAKLMSDFIQFNPERGTLAGGAKVRIKLNISPGFPGELTQALIVQIAHFEPEKILIKGFGLFPSLRIEAQRKVTHELIKIMKATSENMARMNSMTQQPDYDQLVQEMKNERVIDVERTIIKQYIKYNGNQVQAPKTPMTAGGKTKYKTASISMDADTSYIKQLSSKTEVKFFDDLILGVYVVNLGTVIAGSRIQHTVKLTNIGKCPLNFSIDMKAYKQFGLSLSMTKVHKLLPPPTNNSIAIQILLQTKKSNRPGKTVFQLPVSVENGGKYILEILASITVPELHLSCSQLDFGNLQIGLSKKIFMRLENLKEIPCEWTTTIFQIKPKPNQKGKDNTPRVQFAPGHGLLTPGSKKLIEVIFEPIENVQYEYSIVFNFKDSPKKQEIVCIGSGIQPLLEFSPQTLSFTSCKPREVFFQPFQIKNNSDYPIELINPDMDQKIIEDQVQLFNLGQSSARADVRSYDDPFWPALKDEIDHFQNVKRLQEQVAQIEAMEQTPENQEAKLELQSQLAELQKVKQRPLTIEFKKQHNVIILSQYWKIDNQLSVFLSHHRSKKHIDIGDIVNWHREEKTPCYDKLQQNYEQYCLQLENAKKKKKPQKGQIVEDDPPYQITHDLITELLKTRLEDQDCQQGVILSNFRHEWFDGKLAYEIAAELLKNSLLYVLDVAEEDGQVEDSNDQSDSDNDSTTLPRRNSLQVVEQQIDMLKLNEDQKDIVMQSLEQKEGDLEPSNIDRLAVLGTIKDKAPQLNYAKITYKQNQAFLNFEALAELPKPNFPDPDNEPLPEPQYKQIIKKPEQQKRLQLIKYFTLLTPFKDVTLPNELSDHNYIQYFDDKCTKWTLEPNEAKIFQIRFVSDHLGEFNGIFRFDSFNQVFSGIAKCFELQMRAITSFPQILKNPVNIYPQKRKQFFKHKQILSEYVASENVFDYGPLIVIQDPLQRKSQLKKRYSAKFRLTNIAQNQMRVQLDLMSQIGDFALCPQLKCDQNVFQLEIEELILEAGETKEVRVWAFPQQQGEFQDSLICLIQDNPNPFKINLKCKGVMPTIQLSKHELNFNRVLIGKISGEQIQITNTSLVHVKWQVVNVESLKQNGFTISKESTILDPGDSIILDINFMSEVQEKKKCVLEIEAQDCQGLNVKQENKQIVQLLAESFHVNVSFTGFSDQQKMILDIGKTLVSFPIEANLGIKNEGIYPIKYAIDFSKPIYAKYFTLQPQTADLNPGQVGQIIVQFNAEKEIKFNEKTNSGCIALKIIERKEIFQTVSVSVRASAEYSQVILDPQQSLPFGPIPFNETRTKTFDITNNSNFELLFEFFNADNQAQINDIDKRFIAYKQEQLQQRIKNKTGPILLQKTRAKIDKLAIGQFTITPNTGVLQQGCSQKIEVQFKGQGAQYYEHKLGVKCTNHNVNAPRQIYMLISESCIPSLETKNHRQIFEEQLVTQSLTSTGINVQNVVQGNVFSVEDNTFYFGNVVPTKNPEGVSERIKLINTSKVPAMVKLEVQKKQGLFAFDVFPKQLRINPHEAAYTKIQFTPDIMAQYDGVFSAIVDNGDINFSHCKLQFDVKGDGTLPSINIMSDGLIQLANRHEPCFDFGQVRVDQKKKGVVRLKNIGVIPATYQCSVSQATQAFKLISPTERTLMPQETYSFEVELQSPSIGVFEQKLSFVTFLNTFEKNQIILKCECVDEVVAFEGFSKGEYTIDFGDIAIQAEGEPGRLVKKQFVIKNYSANTLRAEIQYADLAGIVEVKPPLMHIPPKMSKTIWLALHRPASFKDSLILQKEINIKCSLISLSQKTNLMQKLLNWDSSKTSKRTVSEIEHQWLKQIGEMKAKYQQEKLQNQKAKEPQYPPKPNIPSDAQETIEIREQQSEPNFEVLQTPIADKKIKIMAKLGTPNVQLSSDKIIFKPTKIFTSRTFQYQVTNNSIVNVNYQWEFFDQENASNDAGGYSITPSSGQLQAHASTDFILRFSPVEFNNQNDRQLYLKLGDEEGNLPKQKIELSASIERPVCHFELPFAISERGERLIEIESLGISNKVIKKFFVINPTDLGYEYQWLSTGIIPPSLRCQTIKGVILPGKHFEMVFEFNPDINTPEKQDIQFNFLISQFSLVETFTLRLKVLQPKIFFSTPRVDFGPLLLQCKGKEELYLKNLDNVPYSFQFVKSTIQSGGGQQRATLKINPLSGLVPPGTDMPITVTFSPRVETSFNYNIQCLLPQKKEPLMLNIKGRGYKLHHEVRMDNCIIDSHGINKIQFGECFAYETRKRQLTIINTGDFNIDFVVPQKPHPALQLSPITQTIRMKESCVVDIVFMSGVPIQFEQQFTLQIVSGPLYTFKAFCQCKFPIIEISPRQLNFGEMILGKESVSKTMNLEFKNLDKQSLSIETDFNKNDWFEVELPVGLTLVPFEGNPNNIVKVPISFKPKKEAKYQQQVNFYVNGRHKIDVLIKAVAITCLFELANPQDFLADFGAVQKFQKLSRSVHVRNYSKMKLSIDFDISGQIQQLRNIGFVVQQPQLTLEPRSSSQLTITYQPLQRQKQFTLPLKCKLEETGEVRELLHLQAACYGSELKIIDQQIQFGSVVINSHLVKRIQVVNLGDLSADFHFENFSKSTSFVLQPNNGNVMPSEQFVVDCTFSPKTLQDQRCEYKLVSHGQDPLALTLIGKGVELPKSQIENLSFETSVRTQQKKSVTVKNGSQGQWNLKPVITTDLSDVRQFFDVPKFMNIGAGQSQQLEVIFQPLTTIPSNPQALLFIPLPDGQALSFNLQGTVLQAKPEPTIQLQLKAKTLYIHMMKVKNWLSINQRFNVEYELQDGRPPIQEGIIIRSASITEAGPQSETDFKLSIFVLKKGQQFFNMYFRNKGNKEYIHYVVQLNVEEAPVLQTIELSSYVREAKTYMLAIENPLDREVTISPDSVIIESKDIHLAALNNMVIRPQSEYQMEIVYMPLLVQEKRKTTLKIQSSELGIFIFEFLLTSMKSTNIPTIQFKAAFGNNHVKNFTFNNYLPKAVQYQYKIERIKDTEFIGSSQSDFMMEGGQINALAAQDFQGQETQVVVKFEPSFIGVSKSILTLYNGEGGEYQFSLIGMSAPPLPKGPFKISSKGGSIEFKNMFYEAKEFMIRTDNPDFQISSVKGSFKLEAKKTLNISIVNKGNAETAGRVILETKEGTQWIYYLQGL